MSKFDRQSIVSQLERECEDWMVKDAKAAFDGDVGAALDFYSALSNELRGTVAVEMWRTKVAVEAYRIFLCKAWDHDHLHVVRAAETRHRLSLMFRYAAFPLPPELPDVVTLWRGTSGVAIDVARMGYSWTTDRDVACTFAMHPNGSKASPLVLTADVAKADIALFHRERGESEAVLIRPPTSVAVDGTEVDWQEGDDRWKEKLRAQKAAMLRKASKPR